VFADQFQRNGVIVGQRFWRFGMATPVLSVEEGSSALPERLRRFLTEGGEKPTDN
jgi:hypothetical protein